MLMPPEVSREYTLDTTTSADTLFHPCPEGTVNENVSVSTVGFRSPDTDIVSTSVRNCFTPIYFLGGRNGKAFSTLKTIIFLPPGK